jgi:glycosyltransferase involved in cell wall biosynthesis
MKNRIIITHPASLDSPGGGTRSCLQITNHLQQLGAEVILVPVSPRPPQKQQNISCEIISTAPHSIHYLFDGRNVAKTVKKIIQQKPVDAVICWDHEGAFLPNLLKLNNIVFGMIAAHPSYTDWTKRPTLPTPIKLLVDEYFRWRLFKSADVVFVSSKFTQQELLDLFKLQPQRITITKRGIDEIFSKVNRIFSPTVSNFIFYGSFAPPKGVFDAIAALGKVAAQGYTNWTLKLAGWGFEQQIKQAVHQHGIQKQVVFLGRLEARDLVRELQWAHLAILPSQVESFGRAIAEAQAAGLAVISYDSGSVPEIVENDVTGWLVSTKQVDLLADAIITAIQNPDKVFQMGMKGRDRVTQKFSWEQTATAILDGIDKAKQRMQN